MPTLRDATRLLLHFNSSWVDGAWYRHAVTPYNGATFNTTDKKFGSAAAQFGSRDWSHLQTPTSDDWVFGTGPYTIDGWFRPTNTNGYNHVLFTNRPNGESASFYAYRDTNQFRINFGTPAGGWHGEIFIGTFAANNWYHIAIVGEGDGYARAYLNGVPSGSVATPGGLYASPHAFFIGGQSNYTHGFGGQIDEFRIVKGLALWTADFSGNLPSSEYADYEPEYWMRAPIPSAPERLYGTSLRSVPFSSVRTAMPSLVGPWGHDLDGSSEVPPETSDWIPGGVGYVFVMRAYRELTPGYVYWEAGEPDPTGAKSPYPPGELSDIVLVAQSR